MVYGSGQIIAPCCQTASYAVRTMYQTLISLASVTFLINVVFGQNDILQDPLDTEPTVIHVCGIIESGSPDLIADYKKIAPAIDIGMNDANTGVLPSGYKLTFHYKDAGPLCSPRNDAFKRIMEYMAENITCHVYLGPSCDDAAADVHSVAVVQDVPVLACPAANIADASGIVRTAYTHLIRNPFFFTDFCDIVMSFLCKTSNYTDIAILVDPANVFFNSLASRMRSFLRGNSRAYIQRIRPHYYFVRSDSKDQMQQLNDTLRDINSTARAILILGPAMFTRNVLIAAVNAGMGDGNYVYIAVELYQSTVWGHLEWEQHDENDRLAKEGMKSMILVCLWEATDLVSNDFENAVRLLSRTKFSHLYRYAAFENVDPVATAFYESIIVYANAVSAVVERGLDPLNSTHEVLAAMRNVTYPSPRGENVTLDKDGDRNLNYVFKEFDLNTEEFVIRIKTKEIGIDHKLDILDRFHMPCTNGEYTCPLPPNMPRCGFDGALCFRDDVMNAAVTAGLAVCTILLLALIVGYLFYRRSIREADPYWWRIPVDEITFSNKGKSMVSLRRSGGSLDESTSDRRKSMTVTVDAALTATYNQNTISLARLPENEFRVTTKLVSELKTIHSLRHPNVQKVVGVVINAMNTCLYTAGEWCSRGSLDDVLENENIKLDWAFKYSLMKDCAEGIGYLHSSVIVSHGFLSAMTCLVDSRFVVKLTDFGISELRNKMLYLPPTEFTDTSDLRIYLWRAPELLRQVMPVRGTQKGDVYSYAILLQQITLRNGPFEEEQEVDEVTINVFGIDIREVVLQVEKGIQPPRRPIVSPAACRTELRSLMIKCWAEDPSDRPVFAKIRETIKKIAGTAGENIIDHLIAQMEQYAADLEKKVAAQTQQFMEEKEKTEELLCQLLPRSVAAALTRGETVNPEQYDMVSIYYSDIVGFTTISAQGTAMDVVALLNSLYSLFDSIIENYDAYKVETIGDAYMIASGLPNRNGDQHGIAIASTALAIVRALESFKILHIPDKKLQVRIGLNCGGCVAGIVGVQMPRYCLFGDTVTITQRLEWSGEPMKIQISTPMKELLQRTGKFQIRERGLTNLKEQGTLMTHWLDGYG